MPEKLKIVAQYAMDEYFGSFTNSTSFFAIEDFIFHTGASLASIYQSAYNAQYAELRQEKSESVVTFSADWLLEQQIEVKRIDGGFVGILLERPMSFPFDKQGIGIQSVKSRGKELDRSNVTETWMYDYLPTSDKIWYRAQGDKIYFFTNGECNVQKVNILYVPPVNSPESYVPDAIIKPAIEMTVGNMKQLLSGNVVKESADNNEDKIIQTEINKKALA